MSVLILTGPHYKPFDNSLTCLQEALGIVTHSIINIHETNFHLLQYNPWGKGHGNPPVLDRYGKIVKPARARDEKDTVKNKSY